MSVAEIKVTAHRRKNKSYMTKVARIEKIDGWLFVLPFVMLTIVFFIGPLIAAVALSFKEYSFLDSVSMFSAKSVGFSNYVSVLKDHTFRKALLNTTLYALGVVPIQLVIALLLAIVVDGKVKGKTFLRTAYYIPTVTSAVAVSVMFMYIFKTDGLLNKFTGLFGIPPYNFFGNYKLALPSIMTMAIWSSVGMYMVIFLAGLQDIPESLYEAASIDGASKNQLFFNITLPLLKPTLFFNLIISLIGCFQIFDQAYIVSGGNGGPMDATMTVMLDIYRTGFREFAMGKACAMAFILFFIIFLLTVVQKKLFGEETRM